MLRKAIESVSLLAVPEQRKRDATQVTLASLALFLHTLSASKDGRRSPSPDSPVSNHVVLSDRRFSDNALEHSRRRRRRRSHRNPRRRRLHSWRSVVAVEAKGEEGESVKCRRRRSVPSPQPSSMSHRSPISSMKQRSSLYRHCRVLRLRRTRPHPFLARPAPARPPSPSAPSSPRTSPTPLHAHQPRRPSPQEMPEQSRRGTRRIGTRRRRSRGGRGSMSGKGRWIARGEEYEVVRACQSSAVRVLSARAVEISGECTEDPGGPSPAAAV